MATKKNIADGQNRLYATLCKVLDALRKEAPPANTIYHPATGAKDGLVNARSRALLHLFLKARFGLTRFNDRERQVTDGTFDGGIDAYHIDDQHKRIYVLQSKFRATAGNFVSSNMSAGDLLKMDVANIVKRGRKTSEKGEIYNAQIRKMQVAISKIPDIGSYEFEIILLGNAEHLSQSDLAKLVNGYSVTQYSHSRSYKELLFPVVNGSYFTSDKLMIEINLDNVKSGEAHLDYNVKAEMLKANIKVLFVPTQEIGRIMQTYKNSILKFNPRSFLGLEKNQVNQDIEGSIAEGSGNEFALFNNDITLISDGTLISSNTAKQGRAQVVVTNPQLVNGGQTAFTLGRLYERAETTGDFKVFKGKEVLLKIISFLPSTKSIPEAAKHQLIGDISKASNSQTKIDDADRRSNDPIQLEVQEKLFTDHGLYYERKRGEFSDGIHNGYITTSDVVNREMLVRIALACRYESSYAKVGIRKYFTEKNLLSILKISDVARYFYGYEVLRAIESMKKPDPIKKDRYQTKAYGQALRYGKYAVVAVCVNRGFPSLKPAQVLKVVLGQWIAFESFAKRKKTNGIYVIKGSLDAVSYYKGSTIDTDLKAYKFNP